MSISRHHAMPAGQRVHELLLLSRSVPQTVSHQYIFIFVHLDLTLACTVFWMRGCEAIRWNKYGEDEKKKQTNQTNAKTNQTSAVTRPRIGKYPRVQTHIQHPTQAKMKYQSTWSSQLRNAYPLLSSRPWPIYVYNSGHEVVVVVVMMMSCTTSASSTGCTVPSPIHYNRVLVIIQMNYSLWLSAPSNHHDHN
jgi:hypothetical protein